jgi:hypothetical protein
MSQRITIPGPDKGGIALQEGLSRAGYEVRSSLGHVRASVRQVNII